MYEPSVGLFNALLNAVGLPPQAFLTSPNQALACLALLTVWKDVGLTMLIFLAGLQAIPSELREAAALDGAGAWRTFRAIILPHLRPSLALALFMTTIAATRIVTPILILTQGGPQGSTTNLAVYSYQESFEFMSPGPASATVVCMLALLALVTVSSSRAIGRKPEAET
jgi:ABC-type sugar transport system permease subunit